MKVESQNPKKGSELIRIVKGLDRHTAKLKLDEFGNYHANADDQRQVGEVLRLADEPDGVITKIFHPFLSLKTGELGYVSPPDYIIEVNTDTQQAGTKKDQVGALYVIGHDGGHVSTSHTSCNGACANKAKETLGFPGIKSQVGHDPGLRGA